MVDITSKKAEYVSRHAPHCCKIWLVFNGNLIQTRQGRFDLVDSPNSSSEPSSSLDSALIPYEGEPQRAEHDDTESPEDFQSILYSEEVTRRREAEEELNKAKAEIKDMETIQKELIEQLYIDLPRLFEMVEKQRDEAVMTTEELLRCGLFQLSVSNEPPPSFICPITREVMQEPLSAADGFSYEAVAIREWLNGHQTSPLTNLRLDHNNLVPNRALRSAIQDWLLRNSNLWFVLL